MLILTRKSDESVIIDKRIEVKILGVRGDQVSLGFSAPKEISIHRKEVFDAIQKENSQATGETPAQESPDQRKKPSSGKK